MSYKPSEFARVTGILLNIVCVNEVMHPLRDSKRQLERLLHALAALIRSCRVFDEFLENSWIFSPFLALNSKTK